eukprot:750701-Hanusia_phi.AAC.4
MIASRIQSTSVPREEGTRIPESTLSNHASQATKQEEIRPPPLPDKQQDVPSAGGKVSPSEKATTTMEEEGRLPGQDHARTRPAQELSSPVHPIAEKRADTKGQVDRIPSSSTHGGNGEPNTGQGQVEEMKMDGKAAAAIHQVEEPSSHLPHDLQSKRTSSSPDKIIHGNIHKESWPRDEEVRAVTGNLNQEVEMQKEEVENFFLRYGIKLPLLSITQRNGTVPSQSLTSANFNMPAGEERRGSQASDTSDYMTDSARIRHGVVKLYEFSKEPSNHQHQVPTHPSAAAATSPAHRHTVSGTGGQPQEEEIKQQAASNQAKWGAGQSAPQEKLHASLPQQRTPSSSMPKVLHSPAKIRTIGQGQNRQEEPKLSVAHQPSPARPVSNSKTVGQAPSPAPSAALQKLEGASQVKLKLSAALAGMGNEEPEEAELKSNLSNNYAGVGMVIKRQSEGGAVYVAQIVPGV